MESIWRDIVIKNNWIVNELYGMFMHKEIVWMRVYGMNNMRFMCALSQLKWFYEKWHHKRQSHMKIVVKFFNEKKKIILSFKKCACAIL